MEYGEKLRATVFSLSENKCDLESAISEWTYRGKSHYLPDDSGICGLCGHKRLRYEFSIYNGYNGNELRVGSECIKKFEICYLDLDFLFTPGATFKIVSAERRRLKEQAEWWRERGKRQLRNERS